MPNDVGRLPRIDFISGSDSTAVPAVSWRMGGQQLAQRTLDDVEHPDASDGVSLLLQKRGGVHDRRGAHRVAEELASADSKSSVAYDERRRRLGVLPHLLDDGKKISNERGQAEVRLVPVRPALAFDQRARL